MFYANLMTFSDNVNKNYCFDLQRVEGLASQHIFQKTLIYYS